MTSEVSPGPSPPSSRPDLAGPVDVVGLDAAARHRRHRVAARTSSCRISTALDRRRRSRPAGAARCPCCRAPPSTKRDAPTRRVTTTPVTPPASAARISDPRLPGSWTSIAARTKPAFRADVGRRRRCAFRDRDDAATASAPGSSRRTRWSLALTTSMPLPASARASAPSSDRFPAWTPRRPRSESRFRHAAPRAPGARRRAAAARPRDRACAPGRGTRARSGSVCWRSSSRRSDEPQRHPDTEAGGQLRRALCRCACVGSILSPWSVFGQHAHRTPPNLSITDCAKVTSST